jgi:hypothetical protein
MPLWHVLDGVKPRACHKFLGGWGETDNKCGCSGQHTIVAKSCHSFEWLSLILSDCFHTSYSLVGDYQTAWVRLSALPFSNCVT